MTTENDKADAEGTRKTSARRFIATYLPTALVFVALGTVAVWGHQTGWKAGKFPSLTGGKQVAAKEDWCEEHAVPQSRCIKCNPELVGANMKDWCPEHGVPESRCTLCHPELLTTGVAGDWCPEHGIPESSCTLCHPEIAVKGEPPPSDTGAKVTLADGAVVPVSAPTSRPAATSGAATQSAATTTPAATSKPAKDPKTCQTHAMRVQFASAEAVKKAGVSLAQVLERPMSASLVANAEVDYNRNRVAQISSAVPARAWRVDAEVGQRVKKGDVLALLDSAEVGKAKAELLQAIAEADLKSKTARRLRSSAESGFRTQVELQEAEAALKSANIRVFNAQQSLTNLGLAVDPDAAAPQADRASVQFLGLPKSLADSLDPKQTTANLLPLTAPFDGVVTERNVVGGEVVEASKPLFVVADTSSMWVTANLPLSDARRVSVGQAVTFRPDGAPDDGASGKVAWVSTAIEEQTRTVKVRAEVENPDGKLFAHTFGKASITIREAPSAIAVPNEAVQWEGCCHIVFVRLTDDIFQTRKVKLGAKLNGFTEVLIGVLPGEVVASGGSHVLKSELLKSALGAGCTDGH